MSPNYDNNGNLQTQSEQEAMLKKLQAFKIQGRDKHGRPLLLIIGKLFPAKLVSVEAVKNHLEEEVFPKIAGKQFSVVYVNTAVTKCRNCPGLSALKSIYDAVPSQVRDDIAAFYFLHPGFQSRLFVATFGRLFFSGVYSKMRYVTRLEFLWDKVRRREIELPEFVYEADEEMEYRPSMDYGLESDHPRIVYGTPGLDSATVSTYSMRCIA